VVAGAVAAAALAAGTGAAAALAAGTGAAAAGGAVAVGKSLIKISTGQFCPVNT